MRRNRWGRTGAALLIAGSVLEAGALGVGTSTSPPPTTLLGVTLLSAYGCGWLLIGNGLIATGYSLVGRGRTAVKVAGVLAWIVGVVEAVQFVVGAPFGPAPAFATYIAYVLAVVVTGLRLLSDRTLGRAVRWSMAVPAICLVVSVTGSYAPLLSLPAMAALPWVGTAAAGGLLIRSPRPSSTFVADTVQG